MNRTDQTGLDAAAHLAAGMTEAALLTQAVGLRVLLAEMLALTKVMPGGTATEAMSDAETEAAFDNMPV